MCERKRLRSRSSWKSGRLRHFSTLRKLCTEAQSCSIRMAELDLCMQSAVKKHKAGMDIEVQRRLPQQGTTFHSVGAARTSHGVHQPQYHTSVPGRQAGVQQDQKSISFSANTQFASSNADKIQENADGFEQLHPRGPCSPKNVIPCSPGPTPPTARRPLVRIRSEVVKRCTHDDNPVMRNSPLLGDAAHTFKHSSAKPGQDASQTVEGKAAQRRRQRCHARFKWSGRYDLKLCLYPLSKLKEQCRVMRCHARDCLVSVKTLQRDARKALRGHWASRRRRFLQVRLFRRDACRRLRRNLSSRLLRKCKVVKGLPDVSLLAESGGPDSPKDLSDSGSNGTLHIHFDAPRHINGINQKAHPIGSVGAMKQKQKRVHFDLGVSCEHFCKNGMKEGDKRRMEMPLKNASAFGATGAALGEMQLFDSMHGPFPDKPHGSPQRVGLANAAFNAILEEVRLAKKSIKMAKVEQGKLRQSSDALMEELRSVESRENAEPCSRDWTNPFPAAEVLGCTKPCSHVTDSGQVGLREMQFRMETMEIKQDALLHKLCGAHIRTESTEQALEEQGMLHKELEHAAQEMCSMRSYERTLKSEHDTLQVSFDEMVHDFRDSRSLCAELQDRLDKTVDQLHDSKCCVAALESHSAELQVVCDTSLERIAVLEADQAAMDELFDSQQRVEAMEMDELRSSRHLIESPTSHPAENLHAHLEATAVEMRRICTSEHSLETKHAALQASLAKVVDELGESQCQVINLERQSSEFQAASETTVEQLRNAHCRIASLEADQAAMDDLLDSQCRAEALQLDELRNSHLEEASLVETLEELRDSQRMVSALEANSAEFQTASETTMEELRNAHCRTSELESHQAVMCDLYISQRNIESLQMDELRNSQCQLQALEVYSAELHAASERTVESLLNAQPCAKTVDFDEVEHKRLLHRVKSVEAERDGLHAAFQAMAAQLRDTHRHAEDANAELAMLRAGYKRKASGFANELEDIYQESQAARQGFLRELKGLLRERANLRLVLLAFRLLMRTPCWQVRRL